MGTGDSAPTDALESSQPRLNVVWMVSVGLGALAIYVINADSGWRLGLPLAIMLLYCLIGWRVHNKNLHRFADSLYFMGFLWTILAFFSATTGSASGEEVASGRLPALFGYAVLTTGVGMFLRVAVLHGHVEAVRVDHDDAARQAEATERLITVLHHGATQLETAIDRAQAALGQLDAASASAAAGLQYEVAQHIAEASGSVRTAIEAGSSQFSSALADAAATIAIAGSGLGGAEGMLAKELEALGRAYGVLGAKALKASQASAEQLEAASEALSGASATLAESASRVQTAGPHVEALGEQVRVLTGSVHQLDAALASLRGATADAASAVTGKTGRDLSAVEDAMRDIRLATETIHSGLLNLAAEVRRELDRPR